ncbi:MAG: hypothetical protein IIB87_07755, partial [Chloroflexi bacterium]|nr:hypothetical protein [Chloroflexota bacterium]
MEARVPEEDQRYARQGQQSEHEEDALGVSRAQRGDAFCAGGAPREDEAGQAEAAQADRDEEEDIIDPFQRRLQRGVIF